MKRRSLIIIALIVPIAVVTFWTAVQNALQHKWWLFACNILTIFCSVGVTMLQWEIYKNTPPD